MTVKRRLNLAFKVIIVKFPLFFPLDSFEDAPNERDVSFQSVGGFRLLIRFQMRV